MGEAAFDDLGALVEAMLPALVPLIRRTPYALYGHSMGSWVAFELVRALRRLGRPQPTHLFVGARRAPHLPSAHAPLSDLPRDAFVTAVQARYQAIPEALLSEPEVLDLFLPTLRADFRLLDRYRYVDEPPLDVPITAFYGEQDPIVARSAIKAWGEHTAAGFSLRPVPGGHFFLQDQADLLTSAIGGSLR